ncbi:unnamed protein product [Prorocentrum cordatum]|uniref:Uncharacterized protein n=1 Tax=Prorocentrum cordatum TaxID=2364126 RepID=A0ABN9VF29_9DINO|nr:unnamed protein product [Polarella glacialis]
MCQDPEGCSRIFRIDRDGARPSVRRGSLYQRAQEITGGELRRLIREARSDLRDRGVAVMDSRECCIEGAIQSSSSAVRMLGPLRSAAPPLAPPAEPPPDVSRTTRAGPWRPCSSRTLQKGSVGSSRGRRVSAISRSSRAATSGSTTAAL